MHGLLHIDQHNIVTCRLRQVREVTSTITPTWMHENKACDLDRVFVASGRTECTSTKGGLLLL
jgi:hypothetical protein